MRMYARIRSGVMLALIWAVATTGIADDWKDAKNAFKDAYKDAKKDASARAKSIDLLQGQDNEDVVELLLDIIKDDDDFTVAEAASHMLATLKSEEAIAELAKGLDRVSGKPERRGLALEAGAAIAHESFLPAFMNFPKQKAKRKDIPEVVGRINGLAALRVDKPEVIDELAKLAADNQEFSIRYAALRALSQIPNKRVIPMLLEAAKTEGRIREAAVRGLVLLTGERKGIHPAPWQQWWNQEGEAFELDKEKVLASTFDEIPFTDDETDKTFYGIKICAKRMVFVLDMSGSMNFGDPKTRMDSLKEELRRLLESLNDTYYFNFIFFSDELDIWRKKKLYEASVKNKENVLRFIEEIEPKGATHTDEAMMLAFDEFVKNDDVETIFLLSDGLPTSRKARKTGGLLDTDKICAQIREANQGAYIRIHAIGSFAKGNELKNYKEPPRKDLEGFLKKIAEENEGQFVAVDK